MAEKHAAQLQQIKLAMCAGLATRRTADLMYMCRRSNDNQVFLLMVPRQGVDFVAPNAERQRAAAAERRRRRAAAAGAARRLDGDGDDKDDDDRGSVSSEESLKLLEGFTG